MGKYIIEYSESAIKDLQVHKKSGNKGVNKKITKIIYELESNPYSGIGNPEPLRHKLSGFWSRRINLKDRILYEVKEEQKIVLILTALGHYLDK